MGLIRNRHEGRWAFIPYRYNTSSGVDLFVLFKTPWLSVEFNRINRPDPSGVTHDHPWSFFSFRIWGGYTEHRMTDSRDVSTYKVVRRGFLTGHIMKHYHSHRISELHGNKKPITLFVFGKPHRRGLRFWRDGKLYDITKGGTGEDFNMLNIYPEFPPEWREDQVESAKGVS